MKVVTAAFFRHENMERVVSRQKSRMLDGYQTWGHPVGYKWIKDPARGGKIMKVDEPAASAVRELFEGYAAGRFETVADAAKFLELDGRIPTDKTGRVYPSRAKAILINLVYTGYLEHLPWGIPLIKAKHQAIISLDIYQRVQERLGFKPKAKYRKDLNVDFPLRGFVLCAACDKPLTASWSTARNGQKHPYYSCKTKGCATYGKSLKRGKVEGDFESVLHTMKPSQAIIELARAITVDMHREKYATFQRASQQREAKEMAMEAKLASLTDKLINTSNPSVEQAIEREIERLEKERRILEEHSRQSAVVDTSLEDALGTVFDFLGNPYGIWTSKDLEDKRLVLKLAFAKQLPYSMREGFGTALTSLPFNIISTLSASEKGMVGDVGFEPTTY
ncbi:MAG: recombinase family protein [Alphaproteobacteria bacterium]|nr:recombinase family protein [Alphaproteobacteria bacterium]